MVTRIIRHLIPGQCDHESNAQVKPQFWENAVAMTTTEPIRCIWHACAWTFFSTNFVSSSQRFRRVFSQQNGGNLPLVTLSIFLSRKVIFVSFLLISVAMVHWFQRFCCGKCTQVFFFFFLLNSAVWIRAFLAETRDPLQFPFRSNKKWPRVSVNVQWTATGLFLRPNSSTNFIFVNNQSTMIH